MEKVRNMFTKLLISNELPVFNLQMISERKMNMDNGPVAIFRIVLRSSRTNEKESSSGM